MSDIARMPRIERTPEQRAEEKRIREAHRSNPIRVLPSDTVSGAEATILYQWAAAIKRERESLGWSVDELAERSKVDPIVLGKLESCLSVNPTIATLFRIVGALGGKLSLNFESS